mmetsp:Transcript_29950/g.69080  ORF Transcript_29950/g.69080 Transcript_29950/m.69080 type:complete len:247 (-) Transcript_29950:106-846(-)
MSNATWDFGVHTPYHHGREYRRKERKFPFRLGGRLSKEDEANAVGKTERMEKMERSGSQRKMERSGSQRNMERIESKSSNGSMKRSGSKNRFPSFNKFPSIPSLPKFKKNGSKVNILPSEGEKRERKTKRTKDRKSWKMPEPKQQKVEMDELINMLHRTDFCGDVTRKYDGRSLRPSHESMLNDELLKKKQRPRPDKKMTRATLQQVQMYNIYRTSSVPRNTASARRLNAMRSLNHLSSGSGKPSN